MKHQCKTDPRDIKNLQLYWKILEHTQDANKKKSQLKLIAFSIANTLIFRYKKRHPNECLNLLTNFIKMIYFILVNASPLPVV
jgi:hypothetical protein